MYVGPSYYLLLLPSSYRHFLGLTLTSTDVVLHSYCNVNVSCVYRCNVQSNTWEAEEVIEVPHKIVSGFFAPDKTEELTGK